MLLQKISNEDKIRFEKIVKIICGMVLEGGNSEDEIYKLEEKFEENEYEDIYFNLIKRKDLMDIEFSFPYYRGTYYFYAEIDLTSGNSAPYTIVYWDKTLEEFEEFIKKHSSVVYDRIVEKIGEKKNV